MLFRCFYFFFSFKVTIVVLYFQLAIKLYKSMTKYIHLDLPRRFSHGWIHNDPKYASQNNHCSLIPSLNHKNVDKPVYLLWNWTFYSDISYHITRRAGVLSIVWHRNDSYQNTFDAVASSYRIVSTIESRSKCRYWHDWINWPYVLHQIVNNVHVSKR